jgi:hydrogenase-4 component B
MGMWPFGQFWLPDAHPAAPSPVSAMLSGVMIKTGVYGLMRYFLWLVPPAGARPITRSAQMGFCRRAAGHHHAVHRHDAGAQAGTIQAPACLPQHRADRLHPAGHGRVHGLLLAMGPGPRRWPRLASSARCFHVLNHGLFKALLFLNAGSMLHATGTQDLNKMGGLMKFMPLTAITAPDGIVLDLRRAAVQRLRQQMDIYVAAMQGAGSAKYLACAPSLPS